MIDGREWIDVLSSGQYFVLRQGGTEPPNSSPLYAETRRGVYVCAGCVAPLFDSTNKFESNTGWPSFASARADVEVVSSLISAEVRCRRCGGHLGDVFNDGARFPGTRAEVTGKRYCIDGAALVFVPSAEGAGPVSGDGLTGRPSIRMPPVRRSGGDVSMMCAAPEDDAAADDKQMSNPELVRLSDVTADFLQLMEAALKKLDTRRVLEGKPKYQTIEGMIDAYVEEAASAGLGWTRDDAESEVVRYLKRQALAEEGSPGQNPDDVFIGVFALIVVWGAVSGLAPMQELPAVVVSPY